MIHDATARLRAPRPVLVLALLLLCAPLARAQTADLVRFQLWTADSLALAGSYFRAFDAAQPLVLLLHDRGASSYALAPLGYGLQDAGAAVFLPDLRGEGDSVNSRRGRVSPARPVSLGSAFLSILTEPSIAISAFVIISATSASVVSSRIEQAFLTSSINFSLSKVSLLWLYSRCSCLDIDWPSSFFHFGKRGYWVVDDEVVGKADHRY